MYNFFFKSPNGWTPGSREWREEAIAAYGMPKTPREMELEAAYAEIF